MAGEMKTTAEIREEWNQRADHYAHSLVALTTKIYGAMIPFLQLTEVQTVVEAACGPGNGVELLRQHIPPTARVLANDISARFVEIVRAKGLPNVEVVEAVNEALPYPDACADRYVSNMSIHHVEFPDRMAAEAFRVLRPGGIAAFSTIGDREKSSMLDVSARLSEKYHPSHHRDHNHFTESELKHFIRSAGFTRVIGFEEMTYIPIVDVALIEGNFLKNPIFAHIYEGLDEEKKTDFRADLHTYLSEVMQEHPLGVQARIVVGVKP